MEKFSQNLLRISLSILSLSFPIGFLFAGFEYLNTKKFLSSKYNELNEKIENYIEDMEETYPETIKYFPSTKLADKSPLATLLLTKPSMKLFQVSEYLKYKNSILNTTDEISKAVDAFMEEYGEKIENYIEDMEETYPETIKYFPSTKLADKSPLATLLLTKSNMKLFQVSEYLKYKNSILNTTDEISKAVDAFMEEYGEKIENYIEDMEETYPETIKYFPSTKLADKSPLATLLLTKSTMKLFQVSEYLKYKNSILDTTDEISKTVDAFIEELRIEYPELNRILPR